MSSARDVGKPEPAGVNRRSFLHNSGGVAAGLAAVAIPPAALAAASPAAAAQLVHPNGDVPSEPVMAYVHDEHKGVVTIVSGTEERTYRDPALARRLLAAARSHSA